MTPEPVRPYDLSAALRLLFQNAPLDRDTRVANALGLVRRGELDPAGLFILPGRRGPSGAVLALALPGAGGLVWPPQCAGEGAHSAAEDALLRRAAAWLRGRGVKIAQALLSPDEARVADALPRNGFAHVTQLVFLRHDLSFSPRLLEVPVRLEYRPYEPAAPAEFHRILQQTYQNTLDCPELNGARGVEDVVAGHRGVGRFDPGLWLLALAAGEPVGVLLMTASPDGPEWETSYVGVVPDARRRGFGRELMLKALAEARAGGAERLTLSVDVRNRPAWDLYRGLGFTPFDRREVFLAVWK